MTQRKTPGHDFHARLRLGFFESRILDNQNLSLFLWFARRIQYEQFRAVSGSILGSGIIIILLMLLLLLVFLLLTNVC